MGLLEYATNLDRIETCTATKCKLQFCTALDRSVEKNQTSS